MKAEAVVLVHFSGLNKIEMICKKYNASPYKLEEINTTHRSLDGKTLKAFVHIIPQQHNIPSPNVDRAAVDSLFLQL